jgi:hypothetical protein
MPSHQSTIGIMYGLAGPIGVLSLEFGEVYSVIRERSEFHFEAARAILPVD